MRCHFAEIQCKQKSPTEQKTEFFVSMLFIQSYTRCFEEEKFSSDV